MYRYIRNKTDIPPCGILNIFYNDDLFRPVVLHSTVAQNRPVGDIRTFQEHQHNLYHIVLYTDGQGVCLLDRREYAARGGTVILVSPGQAHDFITRFGSAVYSELTFAFENQRTEPLTLPIERLLEHWAGAPIHLDNPIQLSESQTHLLNTHIIEVTDLAAVDHPLSEYYLQYALVKLLHFIVQAGTRPAAPGAIADERLIRVRRHIEQHYNTSMSIEELSQLAGLSRGYLFRAFRKAFGTTPLNYQKQLRLEAARTLLRSSALRCTEIAVRCGYENIHFFHRLFKQTFGITPMQYRKNPHFGPP